ncbi:hypothetical protein ABFY59_28570 [Priestia aryabhattai]|uniref:hypothetical protein n=1 Tax=Priestia aryabhattai TaxID=412384 RepID=UPI003D28505F
MKKYRMVIIFLVIIFSVSLAVKLIFTDKQRISDEFANQLYNYPIPPQTEIIKKGKSNGKFAGAFGNGDYWNAFSYMTLSSKLSQEEILDYYRNTDLFISPESNKKTIPIEIYFKGHLIKEKHFQEYYYTLNHGFRGLLTRYIDDNGQIKEGYKVEKSPKGKIEYTIQIHGQFNYFPKIS